MSVWLVIIAGFLFVCVLASKVSAKSGIPALILFLAIGMLAGSDGPGGIQFTDIGLTKNVGMFSLAFILFAGGLGTAWEHLKPVFWRSVSLSTIGVFATCGFVGLFAHYVLELPLLAALLLGAVVSSTDAAAVFGVLRTAGTRLKHNITPTLELESGTNDPVAVFLTITLTDLIIHPQTSWLSAVPKLIMEMPIGFAIGWLGGMGAVAMINRVRLEYDGLYSIITIATACFAFGAAELLRGNAFLAVYVAGVTMGSRNFLHRNALIQFHDALAWLMQIAMFVVLGLLVFPKNLVSVAAPGIILSLFLILVARPVAVYLSLLFANMQKRTKFFVAWAGLRGAVPIILATIPALAGVPEAPMIFNLVFFIVLTSVLIQGTTLRRTARALNVVVPAQTHASDLKEATAEDLFEVEIQKGSKAAGKQVVELGLPRTALIVLLNRGEATYIPQGATVLQPGDVLVLATRRGGQDELRRRFQ